MAEGGEETDPLIEHDDQEDDDDETFNFDPHRSGETSSPKETFEMRTRLHEKSGLPDTSYEEETPLLGAQAEQERSWTVLKGLFPEASAIDLETSYKKGRLQVKMMGSGKKTYPLFSAEKGTGKQHLNPQLTKEIKKSLGPMAQELIDKKK